MSTRHRFLLCTIAFAACFAGSSRAQELERPSIGPKGIQASLRTDWYGVYLKGKKIGYFQATRAKADAHVIESFTLKMKLVSFGKKAEMSMSQALKFRDKAPYELVEAEFRQDAGDSGQQIQLKKTDQGFDVVARLADQETKKKIGKLDYTLADAMASELWLRRGPKPGAGITLRDLDIQDLKIESQTSKVLSHKESLVGGVTVRYFEVETISRKDQVKFVALYDDQGILLSGTLGGLFELRMETEEQAKNTEHSQDLFVLGMAKIDRELGLTKKVTELVIEVEAKEVEGLENGPRQTISKRDNGAWIIKLGKKHGIESKASAKEIEDGLAETNTYCISHAKVKALADQAVGDAKTPEEKLKRVVDFVHRFVKPSLSASLPNIHDLMDKKKGDCKSYALLTTTLCRAAGIPSREVSGLVYMGDDQKAFGGHAWNEVVLDGVWIPVDASLRQTEVDATHICFGHETRAANNLLATLGRLSFKLVEVRSAQ